MDLQKLINTKIWNQYGSTYKKKYKSYLDVTLEVAVKTLRSLMAEKKKDIIIRLSPFMYCYIWAAYKVIYGHGCFWYQGLKFVPDGRIDYEEEKHLYIAG